MVLSRFKVTIACGVLVGIIVLQVSRLAILKMLQIVLSCPSIFLSCNLVWLSTLSKTNSFV